MLQVSTPLSSQDWQDYYQLRWQVLRAPWQQPRGSEQDEFEEEAEHRFIKNEQEQVLGVARLHWNTGEQAQVRYMAVNEAHRGHHVGSRLLFELEHLAWLEGAKELVLYARDRAVEFYKKHGYDVVEKAHLMYGDVQHWKMMKVCPSCPGWFLHPEWTKVLQNTWREDIPISDAMGIKVQSYTDWQFTTSAEFSANQNLHGTMFAGSIYSLATLTGWGATYLQMKEQGVEGAIVLSDANIKYLKPLKHDPKGVVNLKHCSGDLSCLDNGKKATYTVPVEIYDGGQLVAQFTGQFTLLPKR
jgi:thioesterase domain-containing protein